jgi:hypothetical protein
LPQASPAASVKQTIGLTNVTIEYHRPSVKGRVIFGKLEKFDEVWRTGANEATAITFSDDVMINGQKLTAGKYALMTIPGKIEWTIIFNKKAEQWGAYEYKKEDDVLRIKVKPAIVANVESMIFTFSNITANSVMLNLEWEKTKISVKIQVEVDKKVMAGIKESITAKPDEKTYRNAANYAFTSSTHADSAMVWINKSISIKENIWNEWLKARICAKAGNYKDALQAAERAAELGKTDTDYPEIKADVEKAIAEHKTKK